MGENLLALRGGWLLGRGMKCTIPRDFTREFLASNVGRGTELPDVIRDFIQSLQAYSASSVIS
jgi:propanediol dehydratase small subunit